MANTNDFYLSFGSNAKAWADGLAAELRPAHVAVEGLRRRIGLLGDELGDATGKAVAATGGGGGGGGGGSTSGDGGEISKSLIDSMGAMVTRLAQYESSMDQIVTAMRTAASLTETVARKNLRAGGNQGRSETAVKNYAANPRPRSADNKTWATKEEIAAGTARPANKPTLLNTPGNFTVEKFAKTIAAQRDAAPTIASTSQFAIDAASIEKLTSHLKTGNQNTKAIRTAVEKIASGAGGAGRGGDSRRVAVNRDQAEVAVGDETAGRIKGQIAKRQRLAAAKAELERVNSGGEFDPKVFNAAAANTKGLRKVGEATNFAGPKYVERLERAISSLTTELKGVPRTSTLRERLAEVKGGSVGKGSSSGSSVSKKAVEGEFATEEMIARHDTLAKMVAERGQVIEAALAAAEAQGGEVADGARAAIARMQAEQKDAERKLSELDKAMVEGTPTGKKPRKSAQERAARRAEEKRNPRDVGLPKVERVNRQADIDLARSPDALRSKEVMKADLQRIAKTFIAEGYEAAFDFNPDASKSRGRNVTNDLLIEGITKARAAYDQGGGVTANDLSVKDGTKVAATEISSAVRKMTAKVVKTLQKSAKDIEAFDIIAMDRMSGGRDYSEAGGASGVPGKMTLARGTEERGAATGGDLKDVSWAKGHVADRTDRIIRTAIDDAASSAKRDGTYDPYRPEITAGIKGDDQRAQDARFSLRKIRETVRAIDSTMKEFIKLKDRTADASKELAGLDKQIEQLKGDKANPGNRDEIAALNKRRNAIQQEIQRDQARMDDMRLDALDGIKAGEMDSPVYRRGLAVRDKSREQYDLAADESAKQAQLIALNRQALKDSREEFFFGQRSNAKQGREKAGGDQSAMASIMPGLGVNRGNIRVIDNSLKRPGQDLKEVQKQWQRFNSALDAQARALKNLDTEKAEKSAKKAHDSYRDMIKAYDALGLMGVAPALPFPEAQLLLGKRLPGDDTIDEERVLPGTHIDVPKAKKDPANVVAAEKEIAKLQAQARAAALKLEKFQRGIEVVGLSKEIKKGTDAFNKAMKAYDAKVRPIADELYALEAQRKGEGQPSARELELEAMGQKLGASKPKESAELLAAKERYEELTSQGDAATRFQGSPDQKRLNTQLVKTNAALAKLEARLLTLKQLPNPNARQRQSLANNQLKVDDATDKRDALLAQIKEGKDPGRRVIGADVTVEGLKAEADATEASLKGLKEKIVAAQAALELLRKSTAVQTEETKKKGKGKAGGTGGTGGGGNAPAGAGGDSGSILERILKRLEGMHATLRQGGKGAAAPAVGPDGQPLPPKPRAPRAPKPPKVPTPEEIAAEAAFAQERAREIGPGLTRVERQQQSTRTRSRVSGDAAIIMGRLSDATKRQVREYAALDKATTSQAELSRRQLAIYTQMSERFQELGLRSSSLRQSFRTIMADSGTRVSTGEVTGIARSAEVRTAGQAPARSAGSHFGQEMGESARDIFASTLFGSHGFWSRVMNSTGTFIVRNFTAGIVFGLSAALGDVIQQAIETESTFIRVSSALESTGRASGNLRTQLQSVSTDYGIGLVDIYETAAGLTGLFDDIDEIAGATRVVGQLEMISNGALNAKEGMGALASITSAFTELSGLGGLEHIADVLTTIQNRLGVNIEVSAEGVGRLSGLAQQLGLTFEETAVYVSEIAKKTNQTGAAAGEQFSRIVSVMQTGRGQAVLKENLGGTGIEEALSAGDYGKTLEILMANYQDLDKAQQDQIATTIGGQRQAASMAALLKDGAQALDTITAATYSKGAADERAAAIANTLNKNIQKLQSNFVNLGAALVRTGLLDVFGAMLIGLNAVLGATNTMLSMFNDFADQNALTSFIMSATFALIGFNIAMKVTQAGLAGLRQFVSTNATANSMVNAARPATRGIPLQDAAGNVLRDPIAGVQQRAGTRFRGALLNEPLGGFRNGPSAAPAAGALATTRFGRGLDAVTTGPMRTFSTGMNTLGRGLTRLGGEATGRGFIQNSPGLIASGGRFNAMGQWAQARGADLSQSAQVARLRASGDFDGARSARYDQERQRYQQRMSRVDSLRESGRANLATRGIQGPTSVVSGLSQMGRANAMQFGTILSRQMSRAMLNDPQTLTSRAAGGLRGLADRATAAGADGGRSPVMGTSLRAARLAANGTATAITGLGAAMSTATVRAIGAQVAMLGFLAVVGLVAFELVRAAKAGADVQKAYEARFTEEYGESEEEKKARYVGPSTDLVAANQKSVTSKMSGGLRALTSVLNPLNWNKSFDQIAEETVGMVPDEISADMDKVMRGAFDSLTIVANDAQATSDDARKAQADAIALVNTAADAIAANDDLSPEQKASALAYYESVLKSVDGVTENTLLNIMGLSGANKMTTDAIIALNGFASLLASSPTVAANNMDGIMALAEGVNAFGGSSTMTAALKGMMTGGTTANMLEAQIAATEEMAQMELANYQTKLGKNQDGLAESQQNYMQLLTTAEQLKRQVIEAETATINETATFLEGIGDYQGAADALKAGADNLKAKMEASKAKREGLQFEKDNAYVNGKPSYAYPGYGKPTPQFDPNAESFSEDEEAKYGNIANQLLYQATEKAVTGANRQDRMNSMQTRNSSALAGLQLKMANKRVEMVTTAVAAEEATDEMLLSAQEAQVQALNAVNDNAQALVVARYAAQSAGMINTIDKARNDEKGAWQAVSSAQRLFGKNSTEYLSALATARTASQQTTTSLIEQAQATRETELARIAPGDNVGRASKTLANALAAQNDAARFGTSSAQYQQAIQQVIEAQRGVDTSLYGITTANSDLAIAFAQAAGKTVDVARLNLEKAQNELGRAQQQSGGARTSDVIGAEAGVTTANAGLRDAALQDRLDTIDFQKNMDQITSRGAISMLTELLNMKDLTEQQRRDILLKIKGLQDELGSTMEGVFNLPENIKMPTVYEVRRALGVDEYIKSMKDATSNDLVSSGVTSSQATANQMLSEIRASVAAGQSYTPVAAQDYSNSNNVVTVNGADFNQVVEWLQSALGAGSQVVRAVTPRRI